MECYRFFFIALLLQSSSAHAWENQPSIKNRPALEKSLKSSNKKVRDSAKNLLDCDARIVKNLAPLLSSSKKELQRAGITLAQIATTRSVDPSTTHAVLAIADLLQEKNPRHFEKAEKLIDDLKNTTESEENCVIAQEAEKLHKAEN